MPKRGDRALLRLTAIAATIGLGIYASAHVVGCGNLISGVDGDDAGAASSGDDDDSGSSSGNGNGDNGGGTSDVDARVIDCDSEDASFGVPFDLACTGLYDNFATKAISTTVHPYNPGLLQWKDGATSLHWAYLPPAPVNANGDDGVGYAKIDNSDPNEWVFPVGFKAWQELSVAGHRVETRFYWKNGASSWLRATYVWSSDESYAVSVTTGIANVGGTSYSIPPTSACDTCHAGRTDRLLGFEQVALSQNDAADKAAGDDRTSSFDGISPALTALVSKGAFKGSAAKIVIPDDSSGKGERALAYLHMNCGVSCHNASGQAAAATSGNDYRLEISGTGASAALSAFAATSTVTTSVDQHATVQPSAVQMSNCPDGGWCRVTPGQVSSSLTVFLAERRNDPTLAMPPIDTNLPDSVHDTELEQWVTSGKF